MRRSAARLVLSSDLAGAGHVSRAALGAVGRRLVGAVGAAIDVVTGDVHRHVGVDGVLLGLRERKRKLGCQRLLIVDLCLSGTTTTKQAARAGCRLRLGVALGGVGRVASAALPA